MDAAEALALLELIEAQEEARHHRRPVTDEDYYKYLVSDGGENNPDEEVWMNAKAEPAAHLYVPPMGKFSPYPYDYGYGNQYAKRFMVAKRKKRSNGSAKVRLGFAG